MKLDGREVMVPFPRKKYKDYLQQIGCTPDALLSSKQIHTFLLVLIPDYQTGKLSPDELSSIAAVLWSDMLDHEAKFTDFGQFLMCVSELSYYLRHPTGNVVESIIEDLLSYYQTHTLTKV